MIEKVIELFEEKCTEAGGVMIDNICYAPKKEVMYENILSGRSGKGAFAERTP